ncbi:MAG: cell division protein FtsH, partial [Actinobacteria bacterium]|nr:cell division protein FtsH [Actinomycetota bacterium]
MREGNVERISTTGTTVEGRFEEPVKYPADSETAEPTRFFETEVPVFADNDELTDALEDGGVVIEAAPINDGRGVLFNLLFGFGPVILLVALFVWLSRRAAGGPLGA